MNWMDWFDLIEEACRTRGWIWANVVGYVFYYFGISGILEPSEEDFNSNLPEGGSHQAFADHR